VISVIQLVIFECSFIFSIFRIDIGFLVPPAYAVFCNICKRSLARRLNYIQYIRIFFTLIFLNCFLWKNKNCDLKQGFGIRNPVLSPSAYPGPYGNWCRGPPSRVAVDISVVGCHLAFLKISLFHSVDFLLFVVILRYCVLFVYNLHISYTVLLFSVLSGAMLPDR